MSYKILHHMEENLVHNVCVCEAPPHWNLPTTFAFWKQNLLAMGIGQVWQETFGRKHGCHKVQDIFNVILYCSCQ